MSRKKISKLLSWKVLLLVLIIVSASFLRLYQLGNIDVNNDEYHIISEAYRFLNHDPYQHPGPNVGHPFFPVSFISASFALFGSSNFTARLPYALSGIALLLIILLFNKSLGGNVKIIAIALMAVSPLLVRESREAYVDSFMAVAMTAVAVFIWRYLQDHKKYWLILTGVASALAISTKFDGLLAPLFAIILLLADFDLGGLIKGKRLKEFLLCCIYIAIPTIVLGFILNDPKSYIDGIIHPADPKFLVSRNQFWSSFLSLPAYIATVSTFLVTSVLSVVWLISLIFLFKQKGLEKKFLLSWQIIILFTFIIYRPGLTGWHGWQKIIPPMVMSSAYMVNRVFKRDSFKMWLITAAIITSSIPLTFFYGFSIYKLPFVSAANPYNRAFGDNFYQRVIQGINQNTPDHGRVFILPDFNYAFLLRSDIYHAYFGDLNSFNVYVVDNPDTLASVADKIKLVKKIEGNQDGGNLVRFIYSTK